jgi:hypothetical protein
MEKREKKGLKKLGGETMKKRLLTMSIVMLAVLVAFSAPAAAVYNFDGYELKTMTNGTIQGDVYVGGGHGTPELQDDENPENPYNQTFDVPGEAGSNGENVTWARLYVGIWGGNAAGGGWLNVTFTNNTGNPTTLKNITCGDPRGDWDKTPPYDPTNSSYNTGCGCWLVALNCTSNVTSGTNTVNASTATSPWDGRVYGIVLVVVYENESSAKVQYWVNEGNVNLHYTLSETYPELNNNVTWFNGTAYNSTEANLTVLYYTGTKNENDYLFLNAPNDASDSPGNVSNDNVGWDNTSYWKYQLDKNNVGNSTSDNCSTNYSECCCCSDCNCCCDCNESVAGETYETDGFDFHCYSKTNDSTPLKDIINYTDNNFAIFWRGHDDNGNGTIDGTWGASNPEGETYLHPILAVLRLKNITHVYDFSDNFSGTPSTDVWAFRMQVNAKPPNTCDVPSTEFTTAQYNNIKADDGTYQSDSSFSQYAAHRFNFSISESASEISKINVTWNGIGRHSGVTDGANLYIWNFTSGAYELLQASANTEAEVTLTGEKTSSIGSYISPSGNVTTLVEQNANGPTSFIETDYVKLVVTPDP